MLAEDREKLALKKAQTIGTGLLKKQNIKDVVFESDDEIFRSQIIDKTIKTKLICNFSVKLIKVDKTQYLDYSPTYKYLFRVKSKYCQTDVEAYFEANNLTTKRSFSRRLLKLVAFGSFCGDKDDFNQFLRHEMEADDTNRNRLS